MATSIERYKEIVAHAEMYGDESAVTLLGISVKTLRNAKGAVRNAGAKENKPSAQKRHREDPLFAKLKSKFGEDELRSLLKMNTTQHPRITPSINFDGDEVSILLVSDTHIGSCYFDEAKLLAAFEEGERQGCSILMHSGDIIEGMSGRPGQIYELTEVGYSAQIRKAGELFASWGKPIFFVTGNHDNWANTKAGVGIEVGKALQEAMPRSTFVGHNEGEVNINGATFMLWHGEDGSSYAHSYRPQKIVEAFSGGEKPAVLFCGHTHKSLYMFDRNVHVVSAGCIERQSSFMRYKRLAAHCGFWIIKAVISDGEIKRFSPTFYPFYK